MRMIIFLFVVLQSLNAQMLSTSGTAIVDNNNQEVILRGIGLGGWMLQEGYMMNSVGGADTQYEFRDKLVQLIGEQETQIFYNNWLQNFVTEADINALANHGYNSVRLAMHYNLFTLPIQEEPVEGENTWLDTGFLIVDNLLDWCEENQIYLILDLHAAPGGQGANSGISDYNPNLPSLWESDFNKSKTVALWGQLADRYKDEPWIGGYDLLNEVNWPLDTYELRNLYIQITNAIRAVDNNHIIYIEGNGYANDFTGLTPPWDSNMVYSFHKYWSYNSDNSLDWVLTMRDQYNIPLWCGETGENSNTWYRDAIKLYEDNNIGWATWPFKRIETIVAPYSASSNSNYESIINFWRGEAPAPSPADAIAGLNQLTTDILHENTIFFKDVIDAQLRLPNDLSLLPYSDHQIPGVIFLSDYDFGINGTAYNDDDYIDYSIDTGEYEPWNKGWNYRNDGVDIQSNNDNFNSNGYHIGYINDGEWMKYTVNIANSGFYDLSIRYASPAAGGELKLYLNESDISEPISIYNSGGWSNFVNGYYEGAYMEQGTHELKVKFIGNNEFNVGSIEFLSSSSVPPFEPIGGSILEDEKTIKLVLSHPVDQSQIVEANNFNVNIDGNSSSIELIQLNSENAREILIEMIDFMNFQQSITVDHEGSMINSSFNNQQLSSFYDFPVENSLYQRQLIPGKIEAEDFDFQSGLLTEPTNDIFGGENIGSTDVGDYAEYLVYVNQTGIYDLNIRYSSSFQQGVLQLQMIGSDSTQNLGWFPIPVTGGWQNWYTLQNEIELNEGAYIMKMTVLQPGFNINWFDFNYSDQNLAIDDSEHLKPMVLPNPFCDEINIDFHGMSIDSVEILDINGRQILKSDYEGLNRNIKINTSNISNGFYILKIQSRGLIYNFKIVKK